MVRKLDGFFILSNKHFADSSFTSLNKQNNEVYHIFLEEFGKLTLFPS